MNALLTFCEPVHKSLIFITLISFDKNHRKMRVILLLISLITFSALRAQVTLYSEDFTGQNGKGATGSTSGISIDTTGVTWHVDTSNVSLSATTDYMKVVNEAFEAQDVDGEGIWGSPIIDISSAKNLTLSMHAEAVGTMESSDFIAVYYQLDGGSKTLFLSRSDSSINSTEIKDTSLGISGTTLQLFVHFNNNAGAEQFVFDSIAVKGETVDATSNVVSPDTQIVGISAPSYLNTASEAFDVLKFSVVDSGTSDALSTFVTELCFKPAMGNTCDFTDHIAGARLRGSAEVTIESVIVTDTCISLQIDSGNLTQADFSSQTLTLSLYFNETGLRDSTFLLIKIDADNHGFKTNASGSRFQQTINNGNDIVSDTFTVSVSAIRYAWAQDASEAIINKAMVAYPVIQAEDSAGNRDYDITEDLTIFSTGDLLGDSINDLLDQGRLILDNVVHTSIGTGHRLYFTPASLSADSSAAFDVGGLRGLSIDSALSPIIITFDSTLEGVNEGQFNGSGLASSPSSGQLNSNAWLINGLSDGNTSFGSDYNSGDYVRGTSTGGVTTGGMYAFEYSSGNRALGFQSTAGDMTPGEVVLRIQNNSSSTFTTVALAFEAVILNNGDYSTEMQLYYSTDSTTFYLLDTATFSTNATADTNSWRKAFIVEALNGINLGSSEYLYIKWSISDNGSASGSRDEVGLDNIIVVGVVTGKSVGVKVKGVEGSYNTLVINGNGAEFEASGDVEVSNQFKLYNGLLNMQGFNLDLGTTSDDIILSGGSEDSYVYGGRIRTYVNSNTASYVIPYGANSINYSRAEITFNSATLAAGSHLDAEVAVGAHPEFGSGVDNYINRYYTITSSGITNPDYDIDLYYADSDVNGLETSIFPVKHDGSDWQIPSNTSSSYTDTMGTGSVDAGSNVLTWNGVRSFSIFSGAGDGNPLPVELSDFRGTYNSQGNKLFWSTQSEINTSRFMIERQVDSEFIRVGQLSAAGSSNTRLDYQLEDEYSGEAFYRLAMEDLDGSITHSNVIHVQTRDLGESDRLIHSWSYGNSINLIGLPEQDNLRIELIGMDSRSLYEKVISTNDQDFESIRLTGFSGPCILRILRNDQVIHSNKLQINQE
jgi:hypothetical protein